MFDACDREESAYERNYFLASSTYWESIPTSSAKWKLIQPQVQSILKGTDDNGLPHFVPTFLPLHTIQFSLVAENFKGRLCLLRWLLYLVRLQQSRPLWNLDHKDRSRPIDILFYGSLNPHREKVWKMFEKLAQENNLRIEFHLDYKAFGFVKETLIDQAKVFLARGSFLTFIGCIESRELRLACP